MATIIEIEGNLVREVTRTVGNEMSLDQFLPLIETRVPVSLPALPKNSVRAVNYDSRDPRNIKLGLLVEVPPRIINMDLSGSVHRLSIPYSRWIISLVTSGDPNSHTWQFEDYYLMWAKQPYTSPDLADMCPAMLPNIYRDSGSICFGSTGTRADQTVGDRIDQMVNEFYASQFNYDLTIEYPNGWYDDYASWEQMTENNPMGWVAWSDWTTRRMYTLNDRLGNLFGRTTLLAAADPIPPMPVGATFGRVDDWARELTNNQRRRIAQVLAELPADMLAPQEA